MKKILVSILLLSVSQIGFSQANKTAYVDIFHILKKSPEYTEATLELEKRAKDWKTQIDQKKTDVEKLKINLSTERALLTQQLIEEKEDEIQMALTELNTLQHDKFGIEGDYFKQKDNINKPILDQIHTISNDIALKKKFDFVLIKGEDNTMVYANKRNDITDLVLKELERSRTRSKMSKKEIEALEIQDKLEASRERQFDKREMLKERQRELEADVYSNSNAKGSQASSTKPLDENPTEKIIRERTERIEAIKAKQDEQKRQQLEKIEAQKLAVKQKQEEQKAIREKAIQDAIDRKNNIQISNTSNTSNKSLTPKQEEMLRLREQQVKEAKAKREKILEERKADMDKRKKEAEEAKNKRLKEIQDIKEKKLKEIEEQKVKK